MCSRESSKECKAKERREKKGKRKKGIINKIRVCMGTTTKSGR